MARQLKYKSKGAFVEEVQRALMKLGYALPKYKDDGDIGPETIAALQEFALHHGRTEKTMPNEEDPIETALIDELLALAAKKKIPKPKAKPKAKSKGVAFVDATAMHDAKALRDTRAWGEIDGVTLHQTGVRMTNSVERFLRLRAHIGIIDPKGVGTIVQVYPLTAVVWHGNGFNRKTVGIEINGLFEGREGKGLPKYMLRKKPKLKPNRASDAQIAAARMCLAWIRDEVARHGGELKYVYAHRQSSSTRQADPGSRVWQDVALWAEEHLGLKTRPKATRGKGRPIPAAWDPRQKGVKY